MRPLKLEVQGFTAFHDLQKVPLEDLDLFVITGPTGAGKSSLLDAMIYALYGRIPRMGAQGLTDFVTHGLAEARIKLEFGVGGDRYRVARRLRRGGASSATFERAEGDGWHSDVEGSGAKAVTRRIEELIKLDFDGFTRAVVLPQGEFQQFLRGDREQRRGILAELLGLSHYEAMGRRARARANELEASVRTTQKILDEQFAEATAEHLAELEVAHQAAKQRAGILAAAVVTATELDGKASILRDARGALQGHSAAIDKIRSTLEEQLAACQAASERERELQRQADQSKKRSDQLQKQAKDAEEKLAELVKQHGTLEALVHAEGALQAHAQGLDDLATRQRRLDGVSAEQETFGKETDTAKGEAEKLKAALVTAKAEAESGEEAARKAGEQAVEIAEQLRRAQEATSEVDQARKDASSCGRQIEDATKAKEAAESAFGTAEGKYRQATEANLAATVAQHLKAGDPCPVCHRALDEAPGIDAHVAEVLDATEQAHEQARELAEEANDAYATAKAADQEAGRRLRRAQEALGRALAGRDGVDILRKEADNTAKAAAKSSSALAAARKQLEAAVRAESEARARAQGLARTLAERGQARNDLTAECKELRRRVTEAARTLRPYFDREIPADAASQIKRRRRAVETASEKAGEARQAANGARDELQHATEARVTLGQELAELDAQIAGLRERCEAAHGAISETVARVASTGKLPALPAVAAGRETHVVRLSAWGEQVGTALVAADGAGEEALDELDRQLSQLAAELEVEVLANSSPVLWLKAEEGAAREEQVRCDAAVQQANQALAKREELSKSIADKLGEIQILKSLAGDLRADRFVQFIVQQTLDLLAVRASEQLMRISADRYSLVSHEGEFSVIDHANADEERSVKTLSGGETFLASLSLALALSQHVGELATAGMGAKLEAVFIDEGFGTLDPETLEDVIDALERLRESNLMIGVITHVPALAERIRVAVRVEKDQNKSRVEIVA